MTSLSADHCVLFHRPPVRFRLRVVQRTHDRRTGKNIPSVIPTGPKEIEAAIAEAHRAGFQQGVREGTDQANRNWSTLFGEILESLVRAVEQLRYEARQALRDCERPLLEMALDLTERIVAREVEEGRYDIGRIVSQALAEFDPHDFELSVRVNPDDLDVVSAIINRDEPPRPVRLLADPDMPAGSARLESEHGNLPADIRTRLDTLRDALLSASSRFIEPSRETRIPATTNPAEASDVH